MQVEQIDKLTAAKRWMSALPRHDFDHILTLIHYATERHRHQARAEVVGEIVAELKTLVDERDRLKLPKSTTAIIRQCAARVEAKFGRCD